MDKLGLLKKSILIIAIILVIIIGIYYCINNKKLEKEDIISISNNETQQDLKLLRDNGVFYTISSKINKYFSYISKKDKKLIYDIYDKEYIKENNITQNNILKFCDEYTGFEIISIEKIYYINKNNISVCVVFGKTQNQIENEESDEKKEFSIIIKLDNNNMTYSIYPYKCSSITDIDKTKLYEMINSIEKNASNEYELYNANNMQISQNYFNLYKKDALNNIQQAYNALNTEYRAIRFNNDIDEYKKYIEEEKEKFRNTKIDKYTISESEDYRDYICIDNYGNYYIFRETSPMQYTVLLDSYTIPTKEFIKRYNSADDKNKSAINVQKFIEMINTKDYDAIYDVMSSSFKENYSINKNNCYNLINNKFFEFNTIKSISAKAQGNYYIVSAEVINVQDKNFSKQIDFVINLKNDMEFEISFSIK